MRSEATPPFVIRNSTSKFDFEIRHSLFLKKMAVCLPANGHWLLLYSGVYSLSLHDETPLFVYPGFCCSTVSMAPELVWIKAFDPDSLPT